MPDSDPTKRKRREQELHVNRERPVDIRLLLLAIFVLVARGIAATGAHFYLQREQSLAERALDQLSGIAELKVREIATWRSQHLNNARTLSRNPFTARALRDYLAGPEDTRLGRQIEAWMDGFREDYGYQNVLLLDRTGAVRASVPDSGPLDPHVLEQVLGAPPRSGPLFFDFHRAGRDGEVMLSLYTAVADPDRPGSEPLGFLSSR
ncbi:cache domain-containing protein [Desulfuromonas sp. TF]|uniref:cache domain-containing protein n=1 Tax=Desulfuromonas sp. TF TaxID=1232410 RepID=UPI00047F2ACC|nr:cache domain-containing protein [Desulfuromonas sp. TF]